MKFHINHAQNFYFSKCRSCFQNSFWVVSTICCIGVLLPHIKLLIALFWHFHYSLMEFEVCWSEKGHINIGGRRETVGTKWSPGVLSNMRFDKVNVVWLSDDIGHIFNQCIKHTISPGHSGWQGMAIHFFNPFSCIVITALTRSK